MVVNVEKIFTYLGLGILKNVRLIKVKVLNETLMDTNEEGSTKIVLILYMTLNCG